MRRLAAAPVLVPVMVLVLAGLPVVAVAATSDLTSRSGKWVRLFKPEVETLVGRSISVDAAGIRTIGTARTFRELDVLVKDRGTLPRGTVQFMRRSVDCAAGTTQVEQWQLLARNGAVLGGSTTAGAVQRVRWDNEDGMVMRYVCSGVLPR